MDFHIHVKKISAAERRVSELRVCCGSFHVVSDFRASKTAGNSPVAFQATLASPNVLCPICGGLTRRMSWHNWDAEVIPIEVAVRLASEMRDRLVAQQDCYELEVLESSPDRVVYAISGKLLLPG